MTTHVNKRNNFFHFLFAFLQTKSLLKKGSTLKGKKFFSSKASVDPFSEGSQINVDSIASLESVSVHLKDPIFLKNRHFLSFNKLIYGINAIIKCGTWQPVEVQLVSLS